MKTINNIKIIGVDAGYGNMKTANFCFRTGLTAYDTEPLFTKNMLVYEGHYYLIGEGHKTYTAEKTLDEDYYILTLAAIAMELNRERLTEADVYLSAGLPLSWVLEQKDAYLAYLLKKSPSLHLRAGEKMHEIKLTIKKAFRIAIPSAIESLIMGGAQVVQTTIVAPLGTVSIAANSFAVTAESLCYMPGYGIADAATTLVGQSVGARQKELAKSFGRITMMMGMLVMGTTGILMYILAPQIIGIMTPVAEVRDLGAMALRIEAFAEPMFAASIVAYGVFVGAADTIIPCTMNFLSIWGVRLTLAALLAPIYGLRGVWIAMCVELCFRGLIFLVRFERGRWLKIKQTTHGYN